MGKKVVHKIDSIVNFTMLAIFMIIFTYGCYALWDSHQLYRGADASQYAMYKPTSKSSISFEELKKTNPDVFGWLTIYGSNIDYPLLQTDNNERYINTNALGEYSLTGSLFLDYRNDSQFTDFNSIIYGHHMAKNAMFGEIQNFINIEYFNSHRYGNLYHDGQNYGIDFFAFLETDGYDQSVYVPALTGEEERMDYYHALLKRATRQRDISITADDHIVLLSTCASEATNGRHILIGKITDETYPNAWQEDQKIVSGNGADRQSLWKYGILAVLVVILVVVILDRVRKNMKKKRTRNEEELHEKHSKKL